MLFFKLSAALSYHQKQIKSSSMMLVCEFYLYYNDTVDKKGNRYEQAKDKVCIGIIAEAKIERKAFG